MRRQTKYTRGRPLSERAAKPNEKKLPDEAFDRVPQMQVTLTRETCWLTKFDGKGNPNTTYPVSASDVARAFNVFNASTGLLPPDVLFWTQVGNQMRLGIYLPPAVRALHFAIRRVETVRAPMPGFIFVGQGTKYWIYAVVERPTNHICALFRAPLPNVNDNGSICAGTVKFPVCDANTIHDAANLFFESAFNLDLSVGKFSEDGDASDERDAVGMNDDTPGTYYDENEYWDDEDEIEADDPRLRVATPRDLGVTVRSRRSRRRERTLLQFLKALKNEKTFPAAQLVPAGIGLKQVIEGQIK